MGKVADIIDSILKRLGYVPKRVRYYCDACNHTCDAPLDNDEPHFHKGSKDYCWCDVQGEQP